MTDAKPDVGALVPVAWVHPFYLTGNALSIECSPVQLGPSQIPLYTQDPIISQQAEIARLTQERDKLKAKCDGWERMMSEALNSGDGSYRP